MSDPGAAVANPPATPLKGCRHWYNGPLARGALSVILCRSVCCCFHSTVISSSGGRAPGGLECRIARADVCSPPSIGVKPHPRCVHPLPLAPWSGLKTSRGGLKTRSRPSSDAKERVFKNACVPYRKYRFLRVRSPSCPMNIRPLSPSGRHREPSGRT